MLGIRALSVQILILLFVWHERWAPILINWVIYCSSVEFLMIILLLLAKIFFLILLHLIKLTQIHNLYEKGSLFLGLYASQISNLFYINFIKTITKYLFLLLYT